MPHKVTQDELKLNKIRQKQAVRKLVRIRKQNRLYFRIQAAIYDENDPVKHRTAELVQWRGKDLNLWLPQPCISLEPDAQSLYYGILTENVGGRMVVRLIKV
jgi:hypothetical protein